MGKDEILRRHEELETATNTIIAEAEQLIHKLEGGQIKAEDMPRLEEIKQKLIAQREANAKFNAELTRLVHEQSDEPTRTPRWGIPHIPRGYPSRQSGRLGWLLASIVSKIHKGYTKGKRLCRCRYSRRSNDSLYRLDKTPKNR